MTEQYRTQTFARDAEWLIGDGLFTGAVNGVAIRSLRTPGLAYDDPVLGKDPQPYHMSNYALGSFDNGGVHINSGIPNHAFYLLAVMLGGYSWERAGQIWYDCMQTINNPMATFVDWASQTILSARAIFGAGSLEERLTERVWKLVGVL